MPRPAAFLTVLAALLLVPAAFEAERPRIAAVRAGGPIRIDGVLDEADWARARAATEFRLIQVREGEVPSDSTSVRVLFDDGHVYFGLRCAGPVRASLAPRDEVLDQDQFSIHLDTYRDFRRAYLFGVNPYGVQFDGILVRNEDPILDWDAVWDAETTRDAGGWSAEVAIPLRALRFPESGEGTWGLWVRRQVMTRDEISSWPLWRQGEGGDIMLQAADLTGLAGLRSGGGLDLQPYGASTLAAHRSWSPVANGFSPWSDDHDVQAGLDLGYGVTSTLAANLTVNPDFSQIEADALQIDVNRRYPLYFTEKRPFFLEGAEVFDTRLDLVYTRRIADPEAGAKLTGRAGNLRLGAIAVRDAGGGTLAGVGGVPIGGSSREGWFGVGRASLDVGENSNVGVLVTAHRSDGRDWGDTVWPAAVGPPTGEYDGGHNLVASADARLRLAKPLFFEAQVAASTTRSDSAYRGVIGGHATFDDVAYSAELEYEDGVRNAELYQQYLGPDFRAETGFLERVDLRRTGLETSFIARPENTWLRSWQPILDGYVQHDHEGRLQEWWVSPMVDWKFQKQTHVHTMVEFMQETWQGREYDRRVWTFIADNSQWRPLALAFGMEIGDGIRYGPTDSTSFLGWSEVYEIEATARPSRRLTAEIAVRRNRFSRGGSELFDVWVLGAKTTWQFTRRLYARIYPQYDTEARHLDADGLLGYVIHPGSVLYLGVNADLDRLDGRQRVTGRTVFLKASWRFQR